MPAFVSALTLLVAFVSDAIPADKARDHVGKEGTYRMTVRMCRNVERSQVYFLNSEKDYHDEKNLAIVIEYEHADAFEDAGIEDPSTYYRDKTIEVTGKVVREREQTRIRVTSPKQIKIIPRAK
jgi:hypothetical protein